MTGFAENDNLLAVPGIGVILPLDAFLQVQHHGAGGIDEMDLVFGGLTVGGRRLAMCPQEHVGTVQPREGIVVDGDQSHSAQAFHLAPVMHNVTETIEPTALLQLFLGLADGAGHAETEPRTRVNFNGHGGISHFTCAREAFFVRT